jgi:hypothetical protein
VEPSRKQTDYDKFKKFFAQEGVKVLYNMRSHGEPMTGDEPKESKFRLSVSQAHFCFDKKKAFLGVLADEMGYFDKKGVQ